MSTVRVGIIGVGGRGSGFLHMFKRQPGAAIVGVADHNRERAERARANLSMQFDIYTSAEELLARRDLDAVIVTTPDYLHKEHALAVLAAGKHLLVDKPIATNVPDGLAIVEAARRSDRVLCMGFNLRYVPVLAEAKRLIAGGAVGRPFFSTALEYYDGGKTYMARWNRLKKYTGGLFLHKGSHDFDILNWFNYPARPERVSAFAGINVLKPEGLPFELEPGEKPGPNCARCPVIHKCPDATHPSTEAKPLFDLETAKIDGYYKDLCIYYSDKDSYDNAVCIVEYDNGARAFHSEVFVTPICNRFYTIVGDLGHMDIDLDQRTIDLRPRWTQNHVRHTVQSGPGGHGGSDPGLVASFVRSIQRGERPRASAIDGVWSIAVGCAAELSRTEKRVVRIEELLDPKDPLLRE